MMVDASLNKHVESRILPLYDGFDAAHRRTLDHLHNKYAEGGYLRLWFDNSPNTARLNRLREIIKDEQSLRHKFNTIYEALNNHEH